MFGAQPGKPISDEVQSSNFPSRFGPIGDNDDHAVDSSHIGSNFSAMKSNSTQVVSFRTIKTNR
jgi:hypothetical protein